MRYIMMGEFGLPSSIGGKTFKVIGATPDKLTSADDLLRVANADVHAFISLYHIGALGGGTFFWLPSQAIEKYLKAFIMHKNNLNARKVRDKYKHNLKNLWRDYTESYEYVPSENMNIFINEVAMITTDIRYGEHSIAVNDNIISGLVVLCVHFNYYKNPQNYSKTYYGIEDHLLSDHHLVSGTFRSNILRAYFHLVIEHQIALSFSGISHPHVFDECRNYVQGRHENLCPICNKTASIDLSMPGCTNIHACTLIKEYVNSSESTLK